ncbi:MAG: hypothetical protein AVDCRST_MAG93-7251, partial [uncultured Chloroflexia bacterium]
WLPKSPPAATVEAMISSKTASPQITPSRSISVTLADVRAVKILLPTATPTSARKRYCAPTRRDPVCGGSGAPSASRPPRSSAGSKKVAALG